MTPFLDDESNPFSRRSIWPKMPQAPMRVGPLPRAAPTPRPPATYAPEPAPALAEIAPELSLGPQPLAAAPAQEDPPMVAPIGLRPVRPRRRELRLTPLIAAAAVGAGGVLALVLMIGIGRATRPDAASTPSRSDLAVGELVGGSTPAPSAPAPATSPATASQPALASRPAPKVAAAAVTPRPTLPTRRPPPAPLSTARAPAADPQPAPPLLHVPAARPAESPLAAIAPPAAAPFVPPPPPDPNAPMPRRVPDES